MIHSMRKFCMQLIVIVVSLIVSSVLNVHSICLIFHITQMCILCSSGGPNIHNTWPHSLVTFQGLSQTPSHQNQVKIRTIQDPNPTTTTSPYLSVASCISDWEQRFSVESSSKAIHPGTPQYRSRSPAPCQGTSSMGRRRGQRWAPDTEAHPTPVVYGLDLEAGKRVSVSVC